MVYYTTIVVYIDCILSNICGILYYNCGINQWWNRVNFLKKISNGNFKEILLDSYCLNDFWILGIGIIVTIPPKNLCVPYMWYTLLYHICWILNPKCEFHGNLYTVYATLFTQSLHSYQFDISYFKFSKLHDFLQ